VRQFFRAIWNWRGPHRIHCFITLNIDGSVVEHGRKAACGGVMRDCNGKFLVAYVVRIHTCSVLKAELWGYLLWSQDYTESWIL